MEVMERVLLSVSLLLYLVHIHVVYELPLLLVMVPFEEVVVVVVVVVLMVVVVVGIPELMPRLERVASLEMMPFALLEPLSSAPLEVGSGEELVIKWALRVEQVMLAEIVIMSMVLEEVSDLL